MAFKFPPPPPPPPPKATSNDSQQPYTSQRGGPGRGRGDRGRGRGGSGRGGYDQGGGSRGNAHGGRGGSRGGYNNTRGGAPQQQHRQYPPSQTSNSSTGPHVAYINPAFANQPQTGGQTQQQMDPNAFAQAMSFMSTPVGMHTMAAFANSVIPPAHGAPSYPQSPPPHHAHPAPRYSPNQQAGQKRKRPEQSRSTQPPLPPKKPQQSGPKPPRAKAAPPPPVPSFGFSLPQSASTQPGHSRPNNKKGNTKRKINLGLTQQHVQDESSSSEEEDIDEEAAFALNTKVEGVAFEHNGEMISLQTPADIQSFIKDRRRNFPTQKRAAEKAEEAAQKRAAELEFLYRVTGKTRKSKDVVRQEKPPKTIKKSREVDKGKQEELAALRKRLHESMVNKQGAPGSVDLGLGYASETDSDDSSSVLSESSVVSSSEESSGESDSESEGGDSDAPEPQSSKVAPPVVNIPPPVQPAQPTRVCHLWGQNGKCRFGASCRYAHPPDRKGKAKEQEKRMGLYEKLVEQELEKGDRLALDAIKYLGQHGFLG